MCAFVYVHIENTLVRGGVERLRRGLLVCVCAECVCLSLSVSFSVSVCVLAHLLRGDLSLGIPPDLCVCVCGCGICVLQARNLEERIQVEEKKIAD